ncbi:hypothetical protein RGQ15_15270 [Paracoccus sp. MBLB3053]|uniref:O-antigen ligase domain-containing protein n=1 Tax=Paracoccus aurantius TaxID=3073814 RepID=A0ABU2HV55_9RHOB|nr:hypothetical protein [Paracoccus sp. MBLB3053]MDS9468926.1 hypothetical protein [Paracoccus sp. MBLB3053]
MQPVLSTPIVFALVLLMVSRGPYAGLKILVAVTPFGMMAAFNLPAVGGMSILATDLLILTLFALVLLRVGIERDLAVIFRPGGIAMPLLILLAYIIFATLFFPRIFAGQTEVFSLSRIANKEGIVSIPLAPTTGNLSQLFRYLLGLCALLAMAVVVRRRPDPDAILSAMKLATGIHIALGVVDIISAAGGFSAILSPIRTANYALTLGQRLAGMRRMIGGFPEASTFGYYSLGLFGFWVSHWMSSRNTGRKGSGIWLALSAFALLRCTSSSAYVGAAGFYFVFLLFRLARSTRMSRAGASIIVLSVAILPLAAMGAYVAYTFSPGFAEFIDRSLLNKLSSDSGNERMSWNAQAFQNFLDTALLGAGLGSVRASNWILATLGSIGLPGIILSLVFYARLFAAPSSRMDIASANVLMALKMGCLALIMRTLVVAATPNMGFLFYVMAGAIVGLTAAEPRRMAQGRSERPAFGVSSHGAS